MLDDTIRDLERALLAKPDHDLALRLAMACVRAVAVRTPKEAVCHDVA